MAGFSDMKKMSNNSVSSLSKELEKINETKSYKDERIWSPERGKDGNGFAILRFLPAAEGEDVPWVRMFNHGFQSKGGWYIENSLTTIGGKDPLGEHNRDLWNTGTETNKETVRKQKRKLSYYSNIYVVKDPTNPQNEGKVFLFKYGKKIFDKIMEAMQPEFEDESPINPFDLWEGANFKLKIVKKDGYWNYDKSEFGSVEPLLDDDDALEALWKKEYSLTAVTAPDQFKSYEELEKRLKMVLGQKSTNRRMDEEVEDEDNDRGSYTSESNEIKETFNSLDSSSEDEDDALSYFQKLAE